MINVIFIYYLNYSDILGSFILINYAIPVIFQIYH